MKCGECHGLIDETREDGLMKVKERTPTPLIFIKALKKMR